MVRNVSEISHDVKRLRQYETITVWTKEPFGPVLLKVLGFVMFSNFEHCEHCGHPKSPWYDMIQNGAQLLYGTE